MRNTVSPDCCGRFLFLNMFLESTVNNSRHFVKAVMKVERPECGYVGATDDVIRWLDVQMVRAWLFEQVSQWSE